MEDMLILIVLLLQLEPTVSDCMGECFDLLHIIGFEVWKGYLLFGDAHVYNYIDKINVIMTK